MLRRVAAEMGRQKNTVILLVIVISAAKICLSQAPRVAGNITDYLGKMMTEGSADESWFIRQCLLLLFLYFVGYATEFFVTKGMVKISQSFICSLRNQAQKKLNRMHISYLDNHPIGDVLSRLTNDVITLSNGLESTVPSLAGQVVLLISLAVSMLKEQSVIVGDMNSLITDTYSNHTLMKAYSCEEEKLQAFEERNTKFRKAYVKSRFLSGLVLPLSILVNNGTYVCLCILGGVLLLNGKMTTGCFLAFILYGNMVATPMTTISNSLNNIQNALAAASRIYDFLDEEEDPLETKESVKPLADVKGEVSFEHVVFGYTPDHILMKDVSIKAPKGSFSAIVGPSGAGKTTLVNLLLRFYEINNGTIRLDETDTMDLSKADLRKNFGMVLQDTWIFDGTIADNIRYGKPDATPDEIEEAAKKAQCHDFISRLSEGYDTHISEEHIGLSAGEKQLIAIARTILADPKILILDEATSQVDTRTEYRIVKAMEELTKGRTTFMIAHRLFTIRNADQIMYMENGDILEVGNHEALMKKNGRYAAMYNT